MGGERPDPLSRLDATAEAMRWLTDICTLETVLARVAATAVQATPGADAVTITVLTGVAPHTAACTDDRVLDLDEQQYADDRGPCLEAARTRGTVRSVVGEHRQDWPGFTSAAEQAGIRATLSAPLLVDTAAGPW